MKLKRPEFIMFDYGQTLIKEGAFDGAAGFDQILRYASSNPDGVTGADLQAEAERLNAELGRFNPATRHKRLTEIPEELPEGQEMVTLELPDFYFNLVYTPNAGDGLKRLAERQIWDRRYADYLAGLDADKPVIACGDYNVAHKEIDLAHPENNHRSAGFTDEEREGFTYLLSRGFTDTFRHIHGDVEGVYSWWAQRIRTSKINNSGWRIDYFLISDRMKDKVVRSEMMDSGTRQDHAPILLEIADL